MPIQDTVQPGKWHTKYFNTHTAAGRAMVGRPFFEVLFLVLVILCGVDCVGGRGPSRWSLLLLPPREEDRPREGQKEPL